MSIDMFSGAKTLFPTKKTYARYKFNTSAKIFDINVFNMIYNTAGGSCKRRQLYTLTGTSTLHTSRSSTTHFLCSWRIAIASPRHCAPIEYSHISFAARVGRATASQSGRVSDAIEHSTREKRSYTLRALRTSSK
jgi:hypothetical protein